MNVFRVLCGFAASFKHPAPYSGGKEWSSNPPGNSTSNILLPFYPLSTTHVSNPIAGGTAGFTCDTIEGLDNELNLVRVRLQWKDQVAAYFLDFLLLHYPS